MKTMHRPMRHWRPACCAAIALLPAWFLLAGADPKTPPATENPPPAAEPRGKDQARAERSVRLLQREFDRVHEEVRRKWQELNALREQLELTDRETEGVASNSPAAESIRILETQLLDSDMKRRELETLFIALTKMSRKDLKSALPTAAPDPVLASLLQNEAAAEQKLVALQANLGEKNPEVRAASKVLEVIQEQISGRLDGILRGMQTRLDAGHSAMNQLRKALDESKRASINRAIAIGPYFLAKRDLEHLQEARDRLQLQLYQERLEAALLEAR